MCVASEMEGETDRDGRWNKMKTQTTKNVVIVELRWIGVLKAVAA